MLSRVLTDIDIQMDSGDGAMPSIKGAGIGTSQAGPPPAAVDIRPPADSGSRKTVDGYILGPPIRNPQAPYAFRTDATMVAKATGLPTINGALSRRGQVRVEGFYGKEQEGRWTNGSGATSFNGPVASRQMSLRSRC